MNHSSILIVGSSNTDMVIQASHFPAPGETVLGGNFFMNPGGKGANQAVAAARLGGNVTFVGKVGKDLFGRQSKKLLADEGIDVRYITTDEAHPSGVALITVDQSGENTIVVASGANGRLAPANIDQAIVALEACEYMLTQLEIPLDTVTHLAQLAADHSKKLVLNPAPATVLSDDLLSKIHLITPNETEAALLTGIQVTDEETALVAATALKDKGIDIVVITMGEKGAFVLAHGIQQMVPAQKVTVQDTTAAGDTFNGALVVALSEGKGILEAVAFANRAAAISVTRLGAQSSVPYRKELA